MTGGVAANAAAAAAAAADGSRKGAVGDFYRFQRRERRRNELEDLRQRFEDDKRWGGRRRRAGRGGERSMQTALQCGDGRARCSDMGVGHYWGNAGGWV